MHRRHDPTYYWATRRLPAEIRPATHALYGYVRTADEIVDGPRRPASAEARRAALDAWERELERGLAAGRSPNPVVGALVDAGRRHRLPLDELQHLHALDADRLRAGADRDLARARGLHGRLGRLGRPHHGAAARRARAPPRRLRPARAGVPARELHPRRARGHEPGPRLPARRGPRALRRAGGGPGRRARVAGAARAARARGPPRALAVRRERARDRRRARLGPERRALRRRDLPARARPRRADRLRRARPARGRARRGRCRAPRSGRCAGDAPGDAARRGAHAAGRRRGARRRAGLRRELRRAGRRARARRRRRRRAGRRPLRARRAPDVGVRGPDAVAGRDGRARGDPPGAALHGVPHAARLRALPAAVELVLVRLPDALPRAVGAVRTPRGSRSARRSSGRGARATAASRSRPDRGDGSQRVRRWSSTRSAGGASSGPGRTCSRPRR